MSKTVLFLVAILFAVASCKCNKSFLSVADANTNVTELINGLFENVNLPDPTTITPCFDEATSANLLALVGEILVQAQSISQISKIESEITDFVNNVPPAVNACLAGNAEIASAVSAYGLTGKSVSSIESQIVKYVIFHFSSVQKSISNINNEFTAYSYDQAGRDAGALALQVLGSSSFLNFDAEDLEDASAQLQELLNGVTDVVSLPHTTTIIPCLDSTTAQNLYTLIGEVLGQILDLEVSKIQSEVQAFASSVPSAVVTCLSTNSTAEATAIANAFGLTGMSLTQIEQDVESYAKDHPIATYDAISTIDDEFEADDDEEAGDDAGSLFQTILGH